MSNFITDRTWIDVREVLRGNKSTEALNRGTMNTATWRRWLTYLQRITSNSTFLEDLGDTQLSTLATITGRTRINCTNPELPIENHPDIPRYNDPYYYIKTIGIIGNILNTRYGKSLEYPANVDRFTFADANNCEIVMQTAYEIYNI